MQSNSKSVACLESETGVFFEDAALAEFRTAVLSGDWNTVRVCS